MKTLPKHSRNTNICYSYVMTLTISVKRNLSDQSSDKCRRWFRMIFVDTTKVVANNIEINIKFYY